MVDVDEYLKEAGGPFLRAQHVQVGDKLQVLDEGIIDDQTFKDRSGRPRPYLVFRAKLMRTGEEYLVRLGPKNVKRIRDAFGTGDTAKWKGRLIEVIGLEDYPGLGQKGVMLRGCAAGEAKEQAKPTPSMLSPQAEDTIVKSADIIEMGIPLNESDFALLPAGVRAELLKGGYVERRMDGDVPYYLFVKEKCSQILGRQAKA
jgi:hypothetical protein